jgi:hypothetical protein
MKRTYVYAGNLVYTAPIFRNLDIGDKELVDMIPAHSLATLLV